MWSERFNCPPAWQGQCPQLVVSKLPNAVQLCAVRSSFCLLSEGSAKPFGMSYSKSLLLFLSIDANTLGLCGSWLWCLCDGGWGRWDTAKDYPPLPLLETPNQHRGPPCSTLSPAAGTLDWLLSEPSEVVPTSRGASFFVYFCRWISVSLYHELIITALQLRKWLGRGNPRIRTISIFFFL